MQRVFAGRNVFEFFSLKIEYFYYFSEEIQLMREKLLSCAGVYIDLFNIKQTNWRPIVTNHILIHQ
jgi:hypothetical protein